ncbi:hypothetical protein PanWU01x14_309220 [Parasponia andersonii]|uniref:Uncharacterized protein n=1 Tax=Parasponia andersonii TaxID=3476 RepID=A0A2P5AQR9_PARAD|nr:hypothetical protein PanWU01x14_309220 [Parasponia andersonii]
MDFKISQTAHNMQLVALTYHVTLMPALMKQFVPQKMSSSLVSIFPKKQKNVTELVFSYRENKWLLSPPSLPLAKNQ